MPARRGGMRHLRHLRDWDDAQDFHGWIDLSLSILADAADRRIPLFQIAFSADRAECRYRPAACLQSLQRWVRTRSRLSVWNAARDPRFVAVSRDAPRRCRSAPLSEKDYVTSQIDPIFFRILIQRLFRARKGGEHILPEQIPRPRVVLSMILATEKLPSLARRLRIFRRVPRNNRQRSRILVDVNLGDDRRDTAVNYTMWYRVERTASTAQ